jgi:MerR family copper efflux transcriptional regulator
VERLTIGETAAQTGWSPRMLRYLDDAGLVTPKRTPSAYRLYGRVELDQLIRLAELRRSFDLELSALAFLARLRRDPALRSAVDDWFARGALAHDRAPNVAWVDWEQRKHERLLAA